MRPGFQFKGEALVIYVEACYSVTTMDYSVTTVKVKGKVRKVNSVECSFGHTPRAAETNKEGLNI